MIIKVTESFAKDLITGSQIICQNIVFDVIRIEKTPEKEFNESIYELEITPAD